MVTERAEDLKSIMSDNATFIQFPPIGSSTSLITIYGDHRVSIQRTIRSIMQLVSAMPIAEVMYVWSLKSVPAFEGLPILCGVVLAPTCPVQCFTTACNTERNPSHCSHEADFDYHWGRDRIQEHVLRNAWA
jgi:hypothetical protein